MKKYWKEIVFAVITLILLIGYFVSADKIQNLIKNQIKQNEDKEKEIIGKVEDIESSKKETIADINNSKKKLKKLEKQKQKINSKITNTKRARDFLDNLLK